MSDAVIDFKTSDVTRACFISYDPQAYFNENAVKIELEKLIPHLNFSQIEKELKQVDKTIKRANAEKINTELPSHNEDVLNRIKSKLNPSFKIKQTKKNYFVPPEIYNALEYFNGNINRFDLQIVQTSPISYGHRIKIATENIWAEINLFHGTKRGYSIVKSTKTGSNAQLADIAAQVLLELLIELEKNR